MPIENLRPTGAVAAQAWTTTANIWDNNTGTSSSFLNVNAAQSLVVGATGTIATNSWGTPASTYLAADLNVNFGAAPTGSNDTIWVEYGEYSGGTYTKIGDLLLPTSAAVTQQTFTATLVAADFGGAGFPNVANLRVIVGGTKSQGADGVTASMYETWIEATIPNLAPLTSELATSSFGTITTRADATNTVLSGQSSTSSEGTITTVVEENRSVTLSGLSSTSGFGSLLTETGIDVNGLSATSSEGTITAFFEDHRTVALTGLSATSELGTAEPLGAQSRTIGLTGLSSTASIGSIGRESINRGVLLGLESSSSLGTATPFLIDDETHQMVGKQLSALHGDMVPFIVEDRTGDLVGESATSSSGDIVPEITYTFTAQLTGVSAAVEQGTFGVYGSKTITEAVRSLAPGAFVELFEIDLTELGDLSSPYYFHAGTNEFQGDVVWAGNTYSAFPMESDGFEMKTDGTMARPTIKIANIAGVIVALTKAYDDMVGAKVTRRRTLVRYLDAVNFADGNLGADPNAAFPDDIYFIDRKSSENKVFMEFELASSLDLNGVQLPRRQVIQNTCSWKYRSAECSYAGGAVADINDITVGDIGLDVCGKRLNSCKMRFPGDVILPYGGFPGAGLVN